MNSIRLKITIDLNRNHALSIHDLNALKPIVERGIASSLPDKIAVDTITVTKIKETRSRERETSQPFPHEVAAKKAAKPTRRYRK